MRLAPTTVSPRLSAAAASRRTEQQARYARVLRHIRDRKVQGHRTATILLRDLGVLIAVVAGTDLAFANGAAVPAVQS